MGFPGSCQRAWLLSSHDSEHNKRHAFLMVLTYEDRALSRVLGFGACGRGLSEPDMSQEPYLMPQAVLLLRNLVVSSSYHYKEPY